MKEQQDVQQPKPLTAVRKGQNVRLWCSGKPNSTATVGKVKGDCFYVSGDGSDTFAAESMAQYSMEGEIMHTVGFIRASLVRLGRRIRQAILDNTGNRFLTRHDGLSRLVTEEFFITFDLLGIDSIEFGEDVIYALLFTNNSSCVRIDISKEYYYGFSLKSIIRNGSRLIVRVGESYRTVPVPDILSEIRSILAKAPEAIEKQRAEDRSERKRLHDARRSWRELERLQ